MKNLRYITLDCGIKCENWVNGDEEWIEIDIYELYEGCEGEINDFNILSQLFKELSEKGFHGKGMTTSEGYYGELSGINLRANRKIN